MKSPTASLPAGLRLVPASERAVRSLRGFDVAGAVSLTAGMLLLVFTLVEAPDAESANTVHREAHGLVADEIFEVTEHS